ncbi:hypothetical protein [Fodinibius saliphilus]|uniref:hypothetical protein n=1 Tax=Fodinibius saliphilus TaxID=1920650 RepID=UPI001109F186|nr:hypothetical protein [Fodinibius saliphilus]
MPILNRDFDVVKTVDIPIIKPAKKLPKPTKPITFNPVLNNKIIENHIRMVTHRENSGNIQLSKKVLLKNDEEILS